MVDSMIDVMRNPTTDIPVDEKSLLERLRADYDVAFRNWSAQVRVLQSIDSGDPLDRGAIEQARHWVEEAAAVYREKRNVFLNHVIASRSRETAHRTGVSGPSPEVAGSKTRPDAFAGQDRSVPTEEASPVRKLARQIWEEAGRPSGTEQDDWRRAEEIIQTRR
ncbi:MAG: DUF2934 domain-containing protein [Bryobacterales bacterium]